jgi:transposase
MDGNGVNMGIGTDNHSSAVSPPTAGGIAIYLYENPVDFRLAINGLSVLVEAMFKLDPFSRNLFCFVSKRRNQIKVLYWQRGGFCLWLKRLEEERLKSPKHLLPHESTVVTLTEAQFLWLLDGLDLRHLKPHRALEYRGVLWRNVDCCRGVVAHR